MNDHRRWSDLVPFYVSGEINEADRLALESHLADCPVCRDEARFWRSVAGEIKARSGLAIPSEAPLDRALAQIQASPRRFKASRLRLAVDLLRGEAAVLRTEIWISAAAVMGLCLAASLVSGSPEAIRLIAPVVAAACLAVIGGPQNDPVFELSQSTPISPGKIILARATLVFGYNLVLAVVVAIFAEALLPGETLPGLIRDGLSPMAFLSALALLLSLSIGTANAVAAAATAWFLRLLPAGLVRMIGDAVGTPGLSLLAEAYRSFWRRPVLLIVLTAILTLAAVLRADRFGAGRGSLWRVT